MVTLAGIQEPRVCLRPQFCSSLGDEAIELARSCGLKPDPWQELVTHVALGTREDGKWSAFEVGINVPRQNGKGGILEIRELAALFVVPDDLLTIHSAHQFDTSMEAFLRMEQLLEEGGLIGELRARSGISRSHGSEGFVLKNGRRLRYRTRTKGGGRGFSCDCLILDEAMFISEFMHGALLPTLSARPNPQVWYTGSAVDQTQHEEGIVFARVRERGHKGESPALAYFEWSANDDDGKLAPEQVEEATLADPALWAQANPAMGIRITPEHVDHELAALGPRTFAIERLGIGDWPPTDRAAQTVIDLELWGALADGESRPEDPVCFAVDVSPSRTSACIAVAGHRRDDLTHLEIVDHRPGTGWVVSRLAELVEKHHPLAVLVDDRGPGSSLIEKLEDKRVKVTRVMSGEYAQACGTLFDLVDQEQVRHLGTAELKAALKGAKTRALGDAWAWARKQSTVDITPLVAVTLALWGTLRDKPSVYEDREVLSV